ncbi:MAG TPA: hypothetical protein PLV60_05035 [Acetomicrobium flavidum]|uniref:hypothetical protein n=1 Tax=Acetomicrobium flavidum TaxID=49896 RepID=UPI002C06009E|nr:hypothetical protein [Acetomicrobium flavidum]
MAENHSENQTDKQGLKRVLKMGDLIAFAIITMVPIAPMGIYGVVAVLSKGHVPLAYVIAACAMVFTAWGYGQFGRDYQGFQGKDHTSRGLMIAF